MVTVAEVMGFIRMGVKNEYKNSDTNEMEVTICKLLPTRWLELSKSKLICSKGIR
jgi:hypothetical protein